MPISAVALVACASLTLIGPANAEQVAPQADAVEDTVQSLAEIPETGPVADAVTFAEAGDGTLVHEAEQTSLTVEAGEAPTIELESRGIAPLVVSGALPGTAEIAEDGTAVFSSDQDYSVAPLPHADGSVQIVTVLEDAAAPVRYNYDFSSNTDVSLQIGENGAVVVLDDKAEWLGAFAVPWAFDAEGTAVPTHFEVEGSTLVQVVDHQSGDYVYPISADPYGGQNLWGWHSVDYYSGDQRVNLRLSAYGKTVAYPWILLQYGWSEALTRSASVKSVLLSKETMKQQFDCHAFGSAFAGDWNLERFRPTRTTDWAVGVAIHHCNWTTATQY
jgi:hypothetical protein